MASFQDKVVGAGMIAIAALVWVYYSVWVLVLPFVDAGHPIHGLFLSREWAITIPAVLLVVGVSLIGGFVALTVAKASAKKKAKPLAKKTQ